LFPVVGAHPLSRPAAQQHQAGDVRIVTGTGDQSGCIVGMRREARLLGRLSRELMVGCAGADPARARLLARRLIDQGVAGLVSFGLAGGLDPALPPGTLLLPPVVLLPDGRPLPSAPPSPPPPPHPLPPAPLPAL